MTKADWSEVSQILARMNQGDERASSKLLPLVYDELRKLAHSKMRHEPAGITLQTTGLVHEAYLRLVDSDSDHWDNRGHFFAAAAEAMRRILVEEARKRGRLKRGGDRRRVAFDEVNVADPDDEDTDILAIDEALTKFESEDEVRSRVVKLRYFGGLTIEQTAEVMGISSATVKRHWTFARAWLSDELRRSSEVESDDADPEDARE